MNYKDYIKTELLILVPVLYLIGVGLKRSKVPDKWIPVLLGVSSVALSSVWVFATVEVFGVQEIASAISDAASFAV